MTCLNCDNEALKESGLCLECEEIESRKINGILYLPALGLIVTLIMTPYSFYILANMMFSNFQQYGIITSYGIFILACVLIYFVIAAVASQAFFRRQKITKKINGCLLYG